MLNPLDLIRNLCARLDPDLVERHLRRMPNSYFERYAAAEISRHLRLLAGLGPSEPVAVETRPLGGPVYEIIVGCLNLSCAVAFITTALADVAGPVVAVSDWMRAVPEQIRPWVAGTYIPLGTDGFWFADARPAARRYFNTDAESVVVGVLEGLASDGNIDESVPVEAARKYKIDDVMAAGVSYKDTGSA